MCVVSSIGAGYYRDFPTRWPGFWPISDRADPEEVRRLKAEVEELKKLLEAADKFDKATGQVDCQDAEKTKFIKMLAETLGVKIDIK